MPSPLAHSAAGYVIFRVLRPHLPEAWRLFRRRGALVLGALCFFSLLPDLDAVPGVLTHDLLRYHNNLTHSLFLAFPVALAADGLARWLRLPNPRWWFAAAFLGYTLHVAMDYFTLGRGIMAFWPLSAARFQPPAYAFVGLRWGDGLSSPNHWFTLLNEALFAVLAVLLAHVATRLYRPRERPAKELAPPPPSE